MLQIKRWLAPPVFPNDAAKTCRASLLNIILLVSMAAGLLIFLGNLAGGKTPPAVTWTNMVSVGICLGLRRWLQTGQVKSVGVVFLALGMTLTTGSIAVLGTIRTPSTALFFLVIVVAGLLFDVTGLLIVTGLSSLAVAGLILAEAAGLLPAPDYSVTITQWSTYTTIFGAGGGLMYYYINTIHLALANAEQELTERKRVENALRESAMNLARSQQVGRMGSWNWDVVGNSLVWSDEIYRIWGVGKDFALTFENITGMIHPDDRELNRKKVQELLATRDAGEFEFRILCPDGMVKWIYQGIEVVRDPSGQPARIFGIVQDVTERKQAEDALRQSEAFNQAILENSPIGISVRSRTGRLLSANKAWKKIWAIPEEDFQEDANRQRQALNFDARDDYLKPYQADLRHIYEQGGHLHLPALQVVHPRPGGAEWVSQYFYAIQDMQGQVDRVVILTEDISQSKRAEETLREYNVRLETEVKARTRELREAQEQLVRQERLAVLGQMASGVGHELRNPLAVILNAVYYLKFVQAEASDKIRQYHSIIEQEARNAEKIITDLLDFARIQAVDKEPVAAPELVQRVLERFPLPGHVQVELRLPADLPQIYVDPRQMEQVLGNLVVNACQAMVSGGELTITAHQEQGMLAVVVKDTGVGIPPENMQKIFEPLFTTKAKGIGLGLAVSQKLAEANGGRIEVESEAGAGSTFTLYLPVQE